MPCSPNDNQIDVDIPPVPPIPGFGIPTSPFQIPLPDFELPDLLIADFLALIQQLGALFPSGVFNPIPDDAMRTIMQFLADILRQISPFLSFYNFILALLKMIKCIIDILCAIPNPFAVAQKVIVLFTECLPPFLNLFPIFALIAMIIALLLLILAIIQYIIDTILAIIIAILRNIEIFVNAVELSDAESILAAVQKIAQILCFLENILAVLVAIAAIINIIKSIAQFAGVTFCASEEEGCCPTALCPPFIKNTPDGINTKQGKLVYLKQIGVDVATVLGLPPDDPAATLFTFPPVRKERWQVYDKNFDAVYKINDIVTPILPLGLSDDFWADEVIMTKNTSPQRSQYTVDLTLDLNPASFPNTTTDTKGTRTFKIKDCIVVEQPYSGLYKYNSQEGSYVTRDITQGLLGVLSIAGGKVYEIDGYGEEVAYNIINDDGEEEQASLNTFLFNEPSIGTELPASDDAIVFDDIEFTWKPNAAALAGYNVTTFGCIPAVALERDILNSVIVAEGIEPIALKLPPFPDVEAAQACVINALNLFRKSISPESAANFQAAALTCMETLKKDVIDSITAAVVAGTSGFKSDYELDTDLQLTSRAINVSLSIRDGGGTLLTNKLPAECATKISENISANVTLGSINSFAYDGYSKFLAQITSDLPGDGNITVTVNSKVLSLLTPAANGNPSSISENIKQYTFVSDVVRTPERRDETDVE